MFDANKQVLLANPVATSFTGLPREGYYLSELYKLFPSLDLEKKLDEAIKEDKIIHIEEAPLVNFFFEIFIVSVKKHQGEIIGGAIVSHDITKMKEVDKLKDELVSIAAHGLRTPLTAIDGLTSMIMDGEYGAVNNNLHQPLKDIITSSERLIHLVNDILKLSRIKAGRLKYILSNFSLSDVIAEVIESLGSIAKQKGLEIAAANSKNTTGDKSKRRN